MPQAPLMLSVSGCRGIFGQSMTPEVAARFAQVVGAFFNEPRASASGPSARPLVVLGRDGRASGDLLARAAAAGLAASGCDVLDCGVATTPTLAVMADARGAAGAIVITASHNPQEWNGLKVIARDAAAPLGASSASAPPKPIADEIINRFRASVPATISPSPHLPIPPSAPGTITTAPQGALGFPSEPTHIHIDRVREALKSIGCVEDRRWQSIKCIVDSVNASGAPGAKALLGTNLIHHLGSSDSGLFPHAPEPTRENLTTLARFVADKHADIGFAQDPDADRLAIIDEKGTYIGEEYTLVLAAEAVLGSAFSSTPSLRHSVTSSLPPTICVNLSTSRMIEDIAARHNARVLRTPVGEAHVAAAMKAHHSPIGGEGNGGVIWPKVTYVRDSISAIGLILALMTRTGKTISQLVNDIPRYAIVKRKVDLAKPEDAQRAVESIARAHAKERVDRQDGVWIGFDTDLAWLHIRGSNTEPIMRLIAEAPTEQLANQLLDQAAAIIAKA